MKDFLTLLGLLPMFVLFGFCFLVALPVTLLCFAGEKIHGYFER